MKLTYKQPRSSLNKAFLKVKPSRSQIETFKSNLTELLNHENDSESEEFHKNLIIDFLKKTYYDPNHFVNTKGRNDLVIHNGNTAKSSVGVIIEAKKPTNKAEMLSTGNINAKALQELVLYFMRERITGSNLEIKHLIVTNLNEWFIFDASIFEKQFAQNKSFVKQFEDFEAKRLSGTDTSFFYKNIASPEIDKVKEQMEFTYFNLLTYEKNLKADDEKGDTKLIPLYKIFSAEHLLKKPFANDSNSLDKKFYSELLHIIGLTETKVKGKKIIERNKPENRNPASLLENAIIKLDARDKILRLDKPSQYGATTEERLFNVALELSITWVNRILFLKLLEAQLIAYHKGDKSYSFLNYNTINDFDKLDSLFFQVLAKQQSDRTDAVKEEFSKVPYLNSSLFEPSDLEHNALFISALDNDQMLPILSSTVLKDDNGKKRTGTLNALEYFFAFLEAYDFSSEGGEDIQEDNKTLINASVLGLIFEKINGYKDGSFFTPGFITMYMCRETIRRVAVQKFNDAYGWKCKDYAELKEDLQDKIQEGDRKAVRQDANRIINSLKICDPAVGSGHFLVSALNEIIAIKSDLKILTDRSGERITDFTLDVVNDELIVSSIDEDAGLFEYHCDNKQSLRIQETLFHEKQTIIENCLFGVDINPNSVKICRLRLWIELLKNSYYKNETELETLPNIDINIKCGNSLISRYALDADIKKALRKSKWSIDSYRVAVDTYRNAQNKEQKREMQRLIDQIKNDFESEIASSNPDFKKMWKLKSELHTMTEHPKLFELTAKEKKAWNEKIAKLTTDINDLEIKLDTIKTNKIYENAFEWRFEFPEVLNNDGEFMGFDAVIGNPPYIRIQELNEFPEIVKWYNEKYSSTGAGNYDLYIPFIEKSHNLLSLKGEHCFINPYKFINSNYGEKIRGIISQNKSLYRAILYNSLQIFEDATTYTGLFFFNKKANDIIEFDNVKSLDTAINATYNMETVKSSSFTASPWNFTNQQSSALIDKISINSKPLEFYTRRIFQGLKTSADKIFILEEISAENDIVNVFCKHNNERYKIEKSLLFPLIKGGDSRAYKINKPKLVILFPYDSSGLIPFERLKSQCPLATSFLLEHKEFLSQRENGKMNGKNWYAFGRNQAIDLIGEAKIFTPDIAPSPRFSFDISGNFYFTGGASGGYLLPKENVSHCLLLGILNSKLTYWYISLTSTQMRGGWYSFESRFIKTIPIVENQILWTEIESKVSLILSKPDKNPLKSTLKEIDQLVYQLYGLTQKEIAIVEAGVK